MCLESHGSHRSHEPYIFHIDFMLESEIQQLQGFMKYHQPSWPPTSPRKRMKKGDARNAIGRSLHDVYYLRSLKRLTSAEVFSNFQHRFNVSKYYSIAGATLFLCCKALFSKSTCHCFSACQHQMSFCMAILVLENTEKKARLFYARTVATWKSNGDSDSTSWHE